MKTLSRTLASFCLLVAAAPLATAQRNTSVFQKGRPLPNLELPTIDGERTINLADLGGKKVLLIQFASW